MDETIEERLAAVERALTDDDHDLAALAEAGDLAERVETLETECETYEDRIAELEAATQALRGYVGNVRAVNEDVRQRADRALELAEGEQPTAGDGHGDTADRTETRREEPTLELDAGDEAGEIPDSQNQATNSGTGDRGESGQQPTRDERQTGNSPAGGQSDHRERASTCPLCNGDGTPGQSDDAADTGNHPLEAASQRMSTAGTTSEAASDLLDGSDREGVPDGGRVELSDDDGSGDTDLLHRIRALL